MIVVHDVGTSEVGELARLVVVGREMVFELNITSHRCYIQLPVADIIYPVDSVEARKEAPSKKG